MRVAAAGSRLSLLLLGAVVLAVARGERSGWGAGPIIRATEAKDILYIEVPH